MTGETKKRRLPRHRRVPEDERPPMALTERDCKVIKAVNDCRALRTKHIEALFFNSRRSTAQSRLSRLFQHEFLERHFLSVVSGSPMSSEIIYIIGKRGAHVLVEQYGYTRSDLRLPKRSTLAWHLIEHLLKINDMRVAVTVAARKNGWELESWLDETHFRASPDYVTLTDRRGRDHMKPVFPDGYFCLNTPKGKARFFLEVDRGTEQLSKFSPQIAVYEAYTASGLYQERFQAKSLRILIVTTTAKRLASLKAVTEKVEGDRKYWFTTFEKITPDTVLTAPIWEQLGDHTLIPLIGGD